MKTRSDDLTSIPGVGPSIAADLRLIGIRHVADLKRADPERLFATLQRAVGSPVDRCVLYVFRSAVYFASLRTHDPGKLKWWNWKDAPRARRRPASRRTMVARS